MKKFIILLCFGVLCTATLAGQPKKRQKVARPAQSIIVLNQTTNKITHIHNANTVRSMASITKLMTAMVVLDTIANLENLIKLKRSYLGRSEFTIRELLDLLLVRSDNHVAEILSRKILTNRSAFITAMNYKASSIGMSNATFIDPSGLNPNNKATAKDIATLVMAANTYTTIREISSQKQIDIKVQTKHQIKTINKFNTNYAILNEFDNITLSKTGTLTAAGRCLALVATQGQNTYIIVILGEPNRIQRDRTARKVLYSLSQVNNT